jgi:hypothetical protein
MLSGHGLVNRTTGSFDPPLSAYRILSPSIERNAGVIEVAREVLMTTPFEPSRSVLGVPSSL